ncbi:MAG TPA: fumarylacetoacetase [Chthoniobacterales bacterium]|jgi:fumarylacetoacetase
MPSPERSFVEVAPDSHFPIQNLPFGVFKPRQAAAPRIGVAIGDLVLDLSVLEELGNFRDPEFLLRKVFFEDSLNPFFALGRPAWRRARAIIQELLSADNSALRDNAELRARVFHKQNEVTMLLPARIGGYTDFYSSYYHAHNVGTMLRGPENALMPNWKWLPVAYHGRASSIVVSGTEVKRPQGQARPPDSAEPLFGPSRSLDFELETAFFVGPGNEMGKPIPIDQAEEHIFGLVLMNDWSARDIQAWEYQPLGPFLAKNFCTSISPWVVTMEALEPFRKPLPSQDPRPLPYLRASNDATFDIHLEAHIRTAAMREAHVITRTNFQNLYWSLAQQVAHHTVGGCNLQTGDLLASGTISGPTEQSRGCLLELTWRGAHPLTLPGAETRKWLEDGDTVSITGWCDGEGFRVGFGEVNGRIVSAN